MYARLLLPFKNTGMISSVVRWRLNYGLAEWPNGRRRARRLLHAQREGPPRSRNEVVFGTGRMILVSDKLQA